MENTCKCSVGFNCVLGRNLLQFCSLVLKYGTTAELTAMECLYLLSWSVVTASFSGNAGLCPM